MPKLLPNPYPDKINTSSFPTNTPIQNTQPIRILVNWSEQQKKPLNANMRLRAPKKPAARKLMSRNPRRLEA
jgi:hypothetical protein